MGSVIGVLKNLGFIINALKTIGAILSQAVKDKRLPSCEQDKQIVELISEALKRKIVDIPGVDEDAVAAWIDQMEKEVLQCKSN